MNKNELLQLIDTFLKPQGYRKNGLSWYKKNQETITQFSLDRSKWGGELYYVYLSVSFKELNDTLLKFNKSDSNLRAENLDEKTEEYLDLENSLDEKVRHEKIEKLLKKSLPILHKMETISGFKELLSEFNPRLFMVKTKAQDFLGVKIE